MNENEIRGKVHKDLADKIFKQSVPISNDEMLDLGLKSKFDIYNTYWYFVDKSIEIEEIDGWSLYKNYITAK